MTCFDNKAEDGDFWQPFVAKEAEVGDLKQTRHCAILKAFLQLPDSICANLLLQLVHKSRPYILYDSRGSRLFQLFNISHEVMLLLIYEEYRASTNSVWNLVIEQCLLRDQDA